MQRSVSDFLCLAQEIEALCLKKLLVRVRSRDQDLFDSGLLDSLLLVQLILELERHFQLELPMADLDISSLRSIDGMARLIARRQEEGAASPPSAVVNQMAG